MKPWKLLPALSCLALACIAFGSTPASAVGSPPVLFKGLQYTALGVSSAKVDEVASPSTGNLVVSNIGSSGQDGVSVDMTHMDGMQLTLDGSSTPADDGASCALSCKWTVVSRPSTVLQTALRYVVSTNGNHFGADLSGLSSSATQTVTVTRAGAIVRQSVVASGTLVAVALDATGSCPNPSLSCSVTRTSAVGQVKLARASADFPSVVHFTVAGADVDGDGLDFSAAVDPDDEDCDGLSCDLLVASPPGSSFSTVRCTDGACALYDQFVEGAGQVQLDVARGQTTGRRRLEVHNLGSSGQDGVSVGLGKSPLERLDLDGSAVSSSSSAVDCAFAPSSLVLDPVSDVGASIAITIQGKLFSLTGAPGAVGEAAASSLQLTLSPSLHLSMQYSPLFAASPESVAVLDHGVEVARYPLPPDGALDVSSPPGQPAAFQIESMGKTHTKTGHVTLMKSPMFGLSGTGQESPFATTNPYFKSNDMSGEMQVSFRCIEVVQCGSNPPVVGDQVVCWGDGSCASGVCYDTFEASSTVFHQKSSTTLQFRTLAVDDFASSAGDVVFADVSGSTVLSSAHTCVTVPFKFARVDQTPMRAYSVTFHLSSELAQCGASVVEGDYLSRVAGTQMFVTDNGGGSFTVDCGILGGVCGATGSGTLFSVDLGAVQPVSSDEGVITVDDVRARDCSNSPVAASAGGSNVLAIQNGAPPAPTSLTAVTQKSGNTPVAGITGGAVAGIVVAARLTPSVSPPSMVTVDVFRAPFGGYPLYDKATPPGHAPSPPASEAGALLAGWTPVTCSSGQCGALTCGSGSCGSSLVDVPPSRDFYYYVAFVRDAFGNTSPASSMTTGTLDYFLGDVSDGSGVCTGDDHVTFYDITALGLHYGLHVTANDTWTCLDVGPTTDFSVDGRPTVDGKVEFEDFVVFAMNFGVVSAPQAVRRPAPMAANASRLVVPALPAVGQTFDVPLVVDGTGDMQALSARLAFDPNVLEQVGVSSGSLLDQQGRPGMALSSESGDVDAALLGAGPGIAGSGEVARVTFRVKSAGDPQLALASITARDGENRTIAIAGGVAGGTAVPAHTALGFAYPNPFRQSLAFQLSLHASGPAAIGVYDVAGRRVRTLLQGEQPAGTRVVTWDGRDDSGVRLAPGAYLVRLEAAGLRETRTVRLVR